MADIRKATEQVVGLNLNNRVLFVADANSGIDFTKKIEELRDDTGYSNLDSIVTIPVGILPPSQNANYSSSVAPVYDFTSEDELGGKPRGGQTEQAQFTDFSNQYLFMQDFTQGINGISGDGAGVTGCGDYILGESVEQSVHRIYTRGKTGTNGTPYHSGSVVKYAYSSGFFGGSAGNVLGGTGGHLEIRGSTTDSPHSSGLSLDGHQAVKIQFWFNLDGVHPPDGAVVFGKKNPAGTTGGPFYMDYVASTNKLRFNASLGNTGQSFNKSVAGELPAGVTVGWHHCQVERSDNQLRIFIDL